MSLAKDKYREETNEDCYCESHQVEGGSYKDEYVLWLERALVNKKVVKLDEIAKELGYTDKAHLEQNIEAYGEPLDKWWSLIQKIANESPIQNVVCSTCGSDDVWVTCSDCGFEGD